MLALNRRFRPREAFAGMPLWSLVTLFMGAFFLMAAIMFPVLAVKVIALMLSTASFVFGVLFFALKDIQMFMDSIFENWRDGKAKFAGGDEE